MKLIEMFEKDLDTETIEKLTNMDPDFIEALRAQYHRDHKGVEPDDQDYKKQFAEFLQSCL